MGLHSAGDRLPGAVDLTSPWAGQSVPDTSRMSQEGQAAHRLMFHVGTFPLWASVSLSGKGGDNPAPGIESKGLVG